MAARIQPGQTVRIRAKDDFYAYCDGWFGRVAGWNTGYLIVLVTRFDPDLGRDSTLELLVPEDQLSAETE